MRARRNPARFRSALTFSTTTSAKLVGTRTYGIARTRGERGTPTAYATSVPALKRFIQAKVRSPGLSEAGGIF